MAGQVNAGVIHGDRLRVARLAADGTTPAGASNMYVTDHMVHLNWEEERQAGEEIRVPNAAGINKIDFRGSPTVRWGNLELSLTIPEPELIELITGMPLILVTLNTRGIAAHRLNQAVSGHFGVSLELWQKAIDPVTNLQHATLPWVRTVFPRTIEWQLQPRRAENGALATVLVGRANENSNFVNGPNNDWTGPTDRWWASMQESAAPPAASVGYVATPAQV